jgi:putative FmdB family regulatory protein
MPIYDYLCEKHGLFEAWNNMDNRLTSICPECGKTVPMKISAPRVSLDPISGDFPGATMSWEKRRNEKMKVEVKQDRTHLE